jgi:hypothetical protein
MDGPHKHLIMSQVGCLFRLDLGKGTRIALIRGLYSMVPGVS